MDWKTFSTTFSLVFLAELGDKTQIATMTLASQTPSRMAVFLGAATALVATSALGVLGGDLVARYVSVRWLHRGAGVAMIVLGALMLRGE